MRKQLRSHTTFQPTPIYNTIVHRPPPCGAEEGNKMGKSGLYLNISRVPSQIKVFKINRKPAGILNKRGKHLLHHLLVNSPCKYGRRPASNWAKDSTSKTSAIYQDGKRRGFVWESKAHGVVPSVISNKESSWKESCTPSNTHDVQDVDFVKRYSFVSWCSKWTSWNKFFLPILKLKYPLF